MSKTKRQNGRATSMARGLLSGLMVSYLITVVSAVIIAKMIGNEILSWDAIGYVIMFVVAVSALAGSMTSYRRIKRQRMMVCGISGLLYWLTLLIFTVLFYGGQYEGVAITTMLIAAGSLISVFITAPKNRRTNHQKYRIPTR